MKNKKLAVLKSVISLLLCVSMLAGTTFAWFTDGVRSGKNTIVAGNLDVELEYLTADGTWLPVQEDTNVFEENTLWEPGHTEVVYLRVSNAGSLALKYQLGVNIAAESGSVNVKGEEFLLSDYIEFAAIEDVEAAYADRAAARAAVQNAAILSTGYTKDGQLLPGDPAKYVAFVVYMPETVANEANYRTGELPPRIELGISLFATQFTHEADSFGDNYDYAAGFPDGDISLSGKTDITTENGMTSAAATITAGAATADVPVGVQVNDGATALELSVNKLSATGSNITAATNEDLLPVDVHVEGVSATNTTPVKVRLAGLAPIGLNMGNLKLYHVENGTTNPMTRVATEAELTAHNQFFYDPATGDVILSMATFSEVTLLADTDNTWNGEFDYDWYDASKTELTIANADQLAAFGAIVGGMKKVTGGNGIGAYTYGEVIKDSFDGDTVKLISDINLGDDEEHNDENKIFYPIGYYNEDGTYERSGKAITSGLRNFEGTFDGNGHSISNFYHNTWEMKGDHDWYKPEDQYYRDGMGLFGRVYGGTIKNLTVENFSSDGEIATTGVIAAYADGATFENIAIFECNPRVYNIGNGGIVGCVGWYAKEADLKTTFKNITVDNSNKISALWGSYDVACGGIVGQYYPTSGQSSQNYPVNAGIHFENCHVSAIMDVYNDVCANYQYYAYRYAGMLIGSVRENVTINGHSYPKMDGITAKDCTVHFGTWNDYYYCEFEKNGHPSYSGPDDYKFSRIPHSEINFTDSNGNGIIDTEGERASVTGCKHTHTPAEDNQCVYLEFNNLVTGYGWGVTTKVVGELEGVTILDRKEGNSVVKFVSNVTELANNKAYKVGDIFSFVDNGVELIPSAVAVSVNNLDENNPVSATIVYDRDNWENGTLTLTGTGKVQITIQDYYFCIPTTITVDVKNPEDVTLVDRFAVAFPSTDYNNRVGNVKAVELGKLFSAKDGIGEKVTVTFEVVTGATVDRTTIETTSENWGSEKVQFGNTGIVKVTISDDNFSKPVTQYLEVVNATNIISAENATGNNVVLLNDISGGFTVSNGCSFYGNGFTVKCAGNGSYRSAAVSYGFVTVETGGLLDNVRIICDIFPESYLYTKEMSAGSDGRYPYGYSAVVVSGNSTISNCYIEGARNNIQVGEGNVTIENTTTAYGSLSNIHIKSSDSYIVTLNNVTTKQAITTSNYDTSKKVYGFGILVGTNESASNAKLKLTGKLTQQNWITKADGTTVSNSYAKSAIEKAFEYKEFVKEDKINTGIVYLNSQGADIDDKRTNSTDVTYELASITMSGYTGQVYSVTNGSIGEEDSSVVNKQIRPTITYNVELAAVASSFAYDGNKDAWVSEVVIDLDNIVGGTFDFKFTNLIVSKYGENLSFTVKDDKGNKVDKNLAITFNQLMQAEYTLVVEDDQIYDSAGVKTDEKVTVEIPFVLKATKTNIDPPKFTNAGTATAIRLVASKGGDWRPAYTVLTGVSVTYWSASESKVKSVDLNTLYNSGTISSNVWTYTCNDYTLTITGGAVHSDGTTITPVVANNTLYFASTNKAFGTATTSRNIILTYVFTDKNASTTWNRTESVKYSDLSEYDYNSFKNNGTLKEPSSSINPCVTPDTLVSLADGTQKRIDQVTDTDKLLVWNFYKGDYAVVPAAIIFDHGVGNNTVIRLTFSDGTVVKVVNLHQFFDATLNRFVSIDAETVEQFVGHNFAKQGGTVRLVDYEVTQEYVEAWGIISAMHYNIIVEGMISTDFMVEDYGLFNYFEVGADMKYDSTKMAADIAKYGLYTYEDFADYLTYEQFAAFNVPYFKIAVGKGQYTYESILNLIDTYLSK